MERDENCTEEDKLGEGKSHPQGLGGDYPESK
jgi:hypothetical protein